MQAVLFNSDQQLIRRFRNRGRRAASYRQQPIGHALSGYLEEVDTKDGTIGLSFEPDATFSKVPGVLQGGAIATMLDFAMSFAALAVIDDTQRVITTSLAISYLRSARIGRFDAAQSRSEMGRIVPEAIWLVCPGLADRLVKGEAP